MGRTKRLKELTIKDNFMFGAVMMDEDNCKGLLVLTSHVFPTQIKNRNPSDRFFVGVPVIL